MLEGWKRKSLADLLEFRNGMNFTQASQGEQVKVIGVGDFKDKEVLNDFSETQSITLNGKVNPDDLLENDDLLFVRSNGNKALIGRCVLISGIAEPISFSGFTIRGRVKSDEIDHSFASKLVRSPLFKEHLHKMGGGSSINNLSQNTLSQFCFSLPPLPEQCKIAEILRTWDEAIEKLEALRAAKERQLAGYTQQLMGRGGVFLERWEMRPLSSISTRIRRQNGGDDHPVMTISAKSGFLMQSDKFSRDMAGRSVDRYIVLHQGEFAYNKGNSLTAPYGCIFKLDRPSALVPFVYFCFALKPELDHGFYEHLLAAGALNHQLSRLINSGVRNDGLLNLNAEDFFGCRVPVPPLNEQRQIGRALTAMKDELNLLDKQIETLTRQKRGLMQKLLTGEWRVTSEAQKEAVG
ncbi:restriction endonuclease subunit S [bacterium SCSIO 12827]|nr:restriction endonuclease subunit S [bacterium SCSIO 12827]